jgi:hypothetical protein
MKLWCIVRRRKRGADMMTDVLLMDLMAEAVLAEDVEECNRIWGRMSPETRCRYVDSLMEGYRSSHSVSNGRCGNKWA